VPDFYLGQLVGLRQSIVIGTRRQADLDSEAVYTEQEQLSPFWSFPDGNVTWFVTWTPGRPMQPFAPGPTALGENFSQDLLITHAAWLAKSTAPYVPLNGGMPPGLMVAQFDTLTSLLFQYRTQGFSFYEGSPSIGPGRFDLYVSVSQTNPERNRGTPLNPAPVPTRIEDIFVAGNPLARYMSVAGDLAVRKVPFSVMRSTAQERWASSEERNLAKYFAEKIVEQAKEVAANKSAPPEVRKEARNILKDFSLARDPRRLTPMEEYVKSNKGRIIRKKTKLH